MARRLLALAPAAGLLTVIAGLAVLDHWTNGPAPLAGVITGIALALSLAALTWWARRPLEPLHAALCSALRSVAESAVAVALVFLLAAPLALLLPEAWLVSLWGSNRATDLMTLMLLGGGATAAARAFGAASHQRARRAEAERDAAAVRAELAERERELVRAEMQALRAQIEPHFLWNTLANVEYLIRRDPPKAEAMLGHLIHYLRASIPDARRGSSTVATELDSVRAYLGLMGFRMGDRLEWTVDADDSCGQVAMPPLVLQTLVENAIKHGLEPLPGPARLRVSVRRGEGERLLIEVADNGVGLQPRPRTRGTGLGLRGVRERLRVLYGDAASLTVVGRTEGGVLARIELPAEGRCEPASDDLG